MKIKVAGAGAGKTTALSEQIIQRYNKEPDKVIYCVSFTNSSVNTITEKLKKNFVSIPENISVSTIHSFLNKEIIAPYYYLLYGKHFKKAINISLPSNQQYKAIRLKQLEDLNILHVEKFSEKAKFVLKGKSNDKNIIKMKREKILDLFSNHFGVLFVDEAQDIDSNFREILEILDGRGFDIELVGDPKQDLKSLKQMEKIIATFPEDVMYISENYRCPKKHVDFSNEYIPLNQRQTAMEKKEGELKIFFEEDIANINDFFKNEKYDLSYIYNKNSRFNTQKFRETSDVFEEIKIAFQRKNNEEGKGLSSNYIEVIASKYAVQFIKAVKNNVLPDEVLKKVFPFGANFITKQEYAKIKEALMKVSTKEGSSEIKVSSIESIKGLEGEKCLFIVTTHLIPYLLKEKNDGKLSACLYVALTRSTKNLDFLFTKEVTEKYSKEMLFQIFDIGYQK